VLLISAIWYVFSAIERAISKLDGEYLSEDGKYIAKIYLVRKPILNYSYLYLVEIYGNDGGILKKISAYNPDRGTTFWSCSAGVCHKFAWGLQDEHFVDLPPTWFDGILAKIP
jgi:hypothetical protein